MQKKYYHEQFHSLGGGGYNILDLKVITSFCIALISGPAIDPMKPPY